MDKNDRGRQKYEKIRLTAFWNATQCTVAYMECFGRICSLHLQDYSPLTMRTEASTTTVKRKERNRYGIMFRTNL